LEAVEANVKGETSLDAWESRKLATTSGPNTEKHKNEYFAAAFSDSISIYLLRCFWMWITTICVSGLSATGSGCKWLSGCGKLPSCFPANPGFEFAVYYKRRV